MALAIGALFGCTSTAAQVLAPPEVDRFARSFIETLRAGTTAEIGPFVGPEAMADSQLPAVVEHMRAEFPSSTPDTVMLIGAEVVRESGKPMVREMTYHVVTQSDTIRVELWVEEAAGRRLVETFKVRRLTSR